MNKLTGLRAEMDKATAEVVAALNKRAKIAQRIGATKQGKDVYVPAREAKILEQISALNNGPLDDNALVDIMREVIGACRNLEQRLRVAYLGPQGTYTEQAAVQFAGRTSSFVSCLTIDDALLTVVRKEADVAVVPIENSAEGSVNHTLDLLLDSSLKIIGEVTLPIHHQLLNKSADLKDIREVVAHPQALAQCRRWLQNNLPGVKETCESSNAEAARLAAQDAHKAAIAGKLAADVYNLQIVGSDIEDSADNTTRFVVLGMQVPEATGNDKTSIVCSVPNRVGSLYELIGIFARSNINMVKLESRPAQSDLWDYVFYIDIDGHESGPHIADALKQTREHATLVKVLGSYPKARV